MKTYYRARFEKVDTVQVESETEHFVTLAGGNRREKKQTDWCSYFQTFGEAKAFLVKKAKGERDDAANRLKWRDEVLRKVEAIKP